MNANDTLLMAILAIGMILINWNIIKKDIFSFGNSSGTTDDISVSRPTSTKQPEDISV